MNQDNDSATSLPPTLLPSGSAPFPDSDPLRIDRYRIIRLLGIGSFGRVYLAHDDELDRDVAVKVPNRERISSEKDLEAYLREAKLVAKLEHPQIVPVYDVGRTNDGLCFVVSKFISGTDLATKVKENRPAFQESAALVASVAEALHYAHSQGLVHRDVKPANILIDSGGKPFVTDFGLALKDDDFGTGAGLAGTPAYMSPEQARGEGHRVDGRSDIFSLGVILYELLAGKRPFRANTIEEVLDQIANSDVRPPRQYDETIPKELERICLKALSRRATDRFTAAWDMAEDLREFLKTSGGTVQPAVALIATEAPPASSPAKQTDSDQRPITIVPKGLRSFDEHDADFFLELLPGPRDRNGLPESIRFWKTRIETTDPDKTFGVGLIYGPSGCGKSSLVRAGLLPRLARHVLIAYVEAISEETESRLMKALRKTCPDLPPALGLVEALALVRQGRVLRSGQKVLLVLDQFEQWLLAKRSEENTELVTALRQCNGEHVQAVVMVRDDFWMAATRFMAELEVELIQGHNIAAVDLFDPRHARKVLTAFGTAYGNLPQRTGDMSNDQHAFLDQAITDLAQDGKVISVRLALFAEMMKGKPWTAATLRDVGGTEGVGVTFLEETFGSPEANPKHRLHHKAAQAVLKALLPETGSDIRGQMRSEQELQDVSGYVDRPRDFTELIHILDNELRLVTPTDPTGSADNPASGSAGSRYYELTHDYLVHSLRDWLSRKQRQTRRGKAEIRLAEAAQLWRANAKRQSLPSFSEWLIILALTKRDKWSPLERRMLHAAARRHRAGLVFALLIIALSCVLPIIGSQYVRATLLADEFRMGINDSAAIENMKSCRFWIDPILEGALAVAKKDHDTRCILRYTAALLPTHLDLRNDLYSQILPRKTHNGLGPEYPSYSVDSDQELALTILQKYDAGFAARMWDIAADKRQEIWHRYFAASMLIEIDPSNARWREIAPDLIAAHDFASEPRLSFRMVRLMRSSRTDMDAELKAIFREALLRKIHRCTESGCPWFLLTEFLSEEEALDLIADGYLSGSFSLDSLKQNLSWFMSSHDYSRLHELLAIKSRNRYSETRRERALNWLKEHVLLTR